MNEWIELFKDATVIAALIYGVFQLAGTYQQKKSKDKQSTELILDISATARNVAEGGDVAVEAMTKVLNIYENRIKELERVQGERTTKIIELEARLTSMRIDDDAKTAGMQRKIDALRSRVAYLEETLKKSNIPFEPRPDDLLDTGEHKAAK